MTPLGKNHSDANDQPDIQLTFTSGFTTRRCDASACQQQQPGNNKVCLFKKESRLSYQKFATDVASGMPSKTLLFGNRLALDWTHLVLFKMLFAETKHHHQAFGAT